MNTWPSKVNNINNLQTQLNSPLKCCNLILMLILLDWAVHSCVLTIVGTSACIVAYCNGTK